MMTDGDEYPIQDDKGRSSRAQSNPRWSDPVEEQSSREPPAVPEPFAREKDQTR